MEILKVDSKKKCEELRKSSAFTIEGLETSNDSLGGLRDWINTYTLLKNERFHVISGCDMNQWYKLSGDNAYPDNLDIVCIKLEDIEDVSKIVMPRFAIGGRWLDDVIDNNLRREKAKRRRNRNNRK